MGYFIMELGHEPYGNSIRRVINKDQGRSPGFMGHPAGGWYFTQNFESRNPKWVDKPFDRLTVLSRVEGLTTLSSRL
jgi:hypothetical protein